MRSEMTNLEATTSSRKACKPLQGGIFKRADEQFFVRYRVPYSFWVMRERESSKSDGHVPRWGPCFRFGVGISIHLRWNSHAP